VALRRRSGPPVWHPRLMPGSDHRTRSVLINVAKLAVVAAVLWFLVIPQFRDAWAARDTVARIDPFLLLAAAGSQVLAYVAHAQLVRSLLPDETRPGLWRLFQIELAARAASHTIPAGTAAGAALHFRLQQRSGVRGADAGFASAVQAVGSAVVLHGLTWGALAVSIPLRGFKTIYGAAAVVGIVLVAFAAVLLLSATRGEDRTARVVRRGADRLPVVDASSAESAVRRLSERVRWFLGDRPALARSTAWSSLHWLGDATSLWLFLAAFGLAVPLDVLLVAFGVASMLASIPVTPRGLGFVEAGLITLLTALDQPGDEVVLGVVAYRLVSFWLPIPVGGVAYLALEAGGLAPPEEPDDEPAEGAGRRAGAAARSRPRANPPGAEQPPG
jgi:putative heme transporter